MGLELTYISGKPCYSFEAGNRFFFVEGKEYEIVGTRSTGPNWDDTIHTIKNEDQTWEVDMKHIVNIILKEKHRL